MSRRNRITIGIVDNDPLVVRALQSMFTDKPVPLQVLWSVRSATEAVAMCDDGATRPDLVLTDLLMPHMDGRELARRLHARHPDLHIIAMTAFQFSYDTETLAAAGISAVIGKEASTQEYVRLIGRVTGDATARDWEERSLSSRSMLLTDREIDILREYLKGRTTAATAHLMHISEGTVKTHMNNAYRKLGVHSRAEAIRICVKEHII